MAKSNDPNPFAPPKAESVPPAADAGLAANFQKQIHALGACWVVIGLLALILSVFSGSVSRGAAAIRAELFVMVGVGALGLAFLVAGALTLYKQLLAVRIGLLLCYLVVIFPMLQLNFCLIVFMAPVIMQAHRVLGWAKKLQESGIPLQMTNQATLRDS